jgi:predicted Zn-dependent protease with MMP-like domain
MTRTFGTAPSAAEIEAHVLVHEVGHHFGLSDEAMHALEDGTR